MNPENNFAFVLLLSQWTKLSVGRLRISASFLFVCSYLFLGSGFISSWLNCLFVAAGGVKQFGEHSLGRLAKHSISI